MTSIAKYTDEKIRLTADGKWLHGEVEITHERTRELFFKSIIHRGGKYFLTGDKAPVPIEVEDAPYFVKSWEHAKDGWGEVTLSDGEREALDPKTLDVGPGDRLYCRVKRARLKALFERKVYYEITKRLTEREGFYGLMHEGVFYPLRHKDEPKRVDMDGTGGAKKPLELSAATKAKSAIRAKTPVKKPPAKKPGKPAKSAKAKIKKTARKAVKKQAAKKTAKKPAKKKR